MSALIEERDSFATELKKEGFRHDMREGRGERGVGQENTGYYNLTIGLTKE